MGKSRAVDNAMKILDIPRFSLIGKSFEAEQP
jgi:hypothetical protein